MAQTDLNKFNTILLDSLIDALTIIKGFSYISTNPVTVQPTQLLELETKIAILTSLKNLYKENYEKFLIDLPKILDEINKSE